MWFFRAAGIKAVIQRCGGCWANLLPPTLHERAIQVRGLESQFKETCTSTDLRNERRGKKKKTTKTIRGYKTSSKQYIQFRLKTALIQAFDEAFEMDDFLVAVLIKMILFHGFNEIKAAVILIHLLFTGQNNTGWEFLQDVSIAKATCVTSF